MVPGVTKTTVGYTGGRNTHPTYESVCAGDGHTEAVRVEYDPSSIDYNDLLDVFFRNCCADSGGDVQYKDAIWFHSDEQKQNAFAALQQRGGTGRLDIVKARPWYDAEEYHQKYFSKN